MAKKKLLIIDCSLLGSSALDVAKHFEKVYYSVPNTDPFPHIDHDKIMAGFEKENIFWVQDYLSVIDECDLIFIPDGNFENTVKYWQNHGKDIFGGTCDWLEDERWRARKEFIKLKLPQIKAVKVVGVEDLKDYLEGETDRWVKLSGIRGVAETHHHIDFINSEYWINQVLIPQLGAKADDVEFVIEDDMPGVEIGIDAIVVDGQFSDKVQVGFEIKDKANVSRIMDYKDAPEGIRTICEALSTILKENKYRNQFSLEIRVGEKDKMFYLTDVCPRAGIPCGSLFRGVFTNFAEMMEAGSQGKLIPAKTVDAKYAVELVLCSETAKHSNLPIVIPDEIFPYVKLKTAMRKEGDVYEHIPYNKHSDAIGSIVAWGNTIEECTKLLHERFDAIKCYDLSVDFSSIETTAMKTIAQAKEMGIDF